MPGLIIAGDSVCLGGGGGGGGPTIQLSGTHSIAEDQPIGTIIGVLSVNGGTGTYTHTIIFDPDSKANLDVDGVTVKLENLLDFETKTFFIFTDHADNGAGSIIDETFRIDVTNVAEGGGFVPTYHFLGF